MKDKRYKPGQLVTIDGHVFRIINGNKQRVLYSGYFTCRRCFDCNNGVDICGIQTYPPKHEHVSRFCYNLPYGYYLKRIR